MTTLGPSLLIGSTSVLQVTRSAIKAWMDLKFGLISTWAVGLAALECLKNPHRLIIGELL